MKDALPLRVRWHIVFVTFTGILAAKILILLPSGLYTITLNYGKLETCAEKLPAIVTINIFKISSAIGQHKSSTQSRETDLVPCSM